MAEASSFHRTVASEYCLAVLLAGAYPVGSLGVAGGSVLSKLPVTAVCVALLITVVTTVPWSVAVTQSGIDARLLPFGPVRRSWSPDMVTIRVDRYRNFLWPRRIKLLVRTPGRWRVPVYLSGAPVGRFARDPEELVRVLLKAHYDVKAWNGQPYQRV